MLNNPTAVLSGSFFLLERYLKLPKVTTIAVRVEGEQSPNPESRVVLVDKVDALGMRRASLDWRIPEEDRQSMLQSLLALAQGIGAAGFGRMMVQLSPIFTSWHHIGTTRMHENEKRGVVDQNCKVHGIANLFIAGSSVFPTAGRVNPTLTIVALAIRLADFLKLRAQPT